MTEDEQIFVTKWSKFHEAGMWKYVLKYGVLWYGVPLLGTLCLMSLFVEFVADGTPPSTWLYVGLALLAGLGFGFCMWIIGDKKYRRLCGENS